MLKKRIFTLLVLFTLFIVLSRALFIFPTISIPVYYGSILLVGLFFLFNSRKIRFNIPFILMLVICLLSIVFNEIPSFFQVESRFFSFIFLILLIGPLIFSESMNNARIMLFDFLGRSFIWITLISFIGYILNIPTFMKGGLFNGITQQSMLMGPIAALSCLFSLHSLLIIENERKWMKVFKVALIVISILVCLLTGSRSAAGAAILSGIFYLKIYYQNNLKKFLRVILSLLFAICASMPIWIPYTENVMKKQEANEKSGGTFSSRETLWEDRIAEFKKSPFIGVGFSVMDTDIARSNYALNGTVEPGTSWLFLLSSIGIFGTIIFSILLISPIWISLNNTQISDSILIVSALFFFMIHLFVEGYVLASGSFLFFTLWLFITLGQKEIREKLSLRRTDFFGFKNIIS